MSFTVKSRLIIQLLCLPLSLLCLSVSIAAEESDMDDGTDDVVPVSLRVLTTNNLAEVGALAEQKGVPILLMFSTEHCPYCKRLEAEVLGPMRKAGIDPKRVILRKVMLDEYDTLRDFTGRERNTDSFATARGVVIVPTLELVNASGETLVPKIVGYQAPDFYAGYLEQAIEVSQFLLEQSKKAGY